MGVAKYRPAIKIVLKLLECISKGQSKGRALKTHVIQCANLKTTSAEKYINIVKDAGYIEVFGHRTRITLRGLEYLQQNSLMQRAVSLM